MDHRMNGVFGIVHLSYDVFEFVDLIHRRRNELGTKKKKKKNYNTHTQKKKKKL
jgi:hypothetical protein